MKMRTKQYLAALCLPLAFAACSDEEFVTDTPSLGNRGTVNVTINAEKPWFDGINTRMTIDGNKFMWEKDKDMIGAARVDHSTMGTVEDKVDVNYAFTAQSNGAVSAFNGKSPIAKGHYLFYYSYADHLEYAKMDLSVPVQEYNVEAATAENGKNALQQAVGYMKMISPIVDLSEKGVGFVDAQNYDLNLSFVNLYTVVKVNVSAQNIKAGTSPKIQKVTLNASGGFVKEAFANMIAISASKANVVAPEAETKQINDEKMAKAIAAIEELVGGASDGTVATIYEQTGVTTANGPAELNIKGDLALSETEKTELYILVPKGKYNGGLTLEITTSEGTYTRTISKPATGNLVLGNAIQPIAAELDFAQNVSIPTKFSIASEADWTNAVNFIESHASSYVSIKPEFTLTADVTIGSLPKFAIDLKGAKTLTLSNDFTINEDNQDKIATSTDTKLGIAAGATLTLDVDCTNFVDILNNGTLNVNADQSKKITNYGTMNVGKDATLSAGLDNGKAAVAGTSEAVEGAINVAEGKTLTISTAAMNNAAGTITVDGTLTNNYASDNTAKIIIGKEGKLNGNAAITNAKGIIENSGTLAVVVTNENGTVIAKDGGKGDNTSAINKGIVIVENVTTFATLQQGASNKYVFGATSEAPSVATEVANEAEYTAANSVTAITNIILTTQRSWTINGSNTPANATTLTLKGVELVLESGLTGKSIVVDGNGTSSITAASAQTITTADLTVNEGATLNVGNYITFNATSGNNQNATILGNLNVAAGAKLYFKTASVGSDDVSGARLTVEGNVAAVDAGDFGVVADGFENWGAIVSKTGDSVAGKISASENKSDSATASGKGIGKATTVTAV